MHLLIAGFTRTGYLHGAVGLRELLFEFVFAVCDCGIS